MKKKKVAWITFNAFLDTDLYIVRELTKFYEINWYIVRSKNDKFEYLDTLENMRDKHDLKINMCVCGRRLRKPECILFYKKMLFEIKKQKNDLLFTSMAGAPYFVPTLLLITKSEKTIMAIHNVHVPKGGSAYTFFKFYTWLTICHFKYFQTFSKSQLKDLKNIAVGKDIMYAPFILKDYGEPSRERTSKLITFLNFGNIREYKRIDVLIEAAQKAYEETGKSFKVIIAGKCDHWDEYKKIIKYDFLFDIRIGRVENDEVANLFNECDYFVAPYQDIAQSGSSVIAINYDKPLIASELPAFKEYINDKENGYLIRPANVKDLTDVMIEILINNNQGYSQMVDKLKDSKNQCFSTDAIIAKYREFFDYVIGK